MLNELTRLKGRQQYYPHIAKHPSLHFSYLLRHLNQIGLDVRGNENDTLIAGGAIRDVILQNNYPTEADRYKIKDIDIFIKDYVINTSSPSLWESLTEANGCGTYELLDIRVLNAPPLNVGDTSIPIQIIIVRTGRTLLDWMADEFDLEVCKVAMSMTGDIFMSETCISDMEYREITRSGFATGPQSKEHERRLLTRWNGSNNIQDKVNEASIRMFGDKVRKYTIPSGTKDNKKKWKSRRNSPDHTTIRGLNTIRDYNMPSPQLNSNIMQQYASYFGVPTEGLFSTNAYQIVMQDEARSRD